MNRREFLTTSGVASLGAVFPRTASCSAGRPPNILFLFTDDQRFDTIRALGNPEIRTPNMDRLVSRGTAFTNAYIMGGQNAAVCMPSRCMLMTGRHLFHVHDDGRSIPENIHTLPESLRKSGYRTFQTGKWHNGPQAFARSFTDAARIFFGGMSDHFSVPVHDFDPAGKYPKTALYRKEGVHSSDLFSDAAIDFLRKRDDDRPFFMYVSYTAPHDPREVPEEFRNIYDPSKLSLPPSFMKEHPFDNGELRIRDEKLTPWPRTPEAIRRETADYYAIISHLDHRIGTVLDALDEVGLTDSTIIVLAGDNGLAVGRHGLLGKQNVYDHSVHVPLVFAGPGIPAGARCDTLCYLYDIFPTLCDFASVKAPGTVDGMSLAPFMRGGSSGGRDSLYFAYKNFQRAVRTDRWKLIYYNVNSEKHTQLFDLAADPWEINNLAGDPTYSGIIAELRHVMQRWIRQTGDEVDLDKPDWGVLVTPSG